MQRRLPIVALAATAAAALLYAQFGDTAAVEGVHAARDGEDFTRSPVETPITVPTVRKRWEMEPSSDPSTLEAKPDPIASIVAVASDPNLPLDFTRPQLDLELLRALRDAVRAGDVDAAALALACSTRQPGAIERQVLVLAAAFARDHDSETDAFFSELAAVEGGDPAVEQEALAAVRALGLAGRSEALYDVTGALIDRATLGEEQGFGGLSRLRTIFALAVLEAGVDVPELEGWIERSGREPRVGGELWGLAVRTAPSLWVEPVIDAARSGDREALVGVESLTGVEQRAAVLDLATGRTSGGDQWLERAAWRALVTSGDSDSFEVLERELAIAGPERHEQLAEALHTWRRAPRPEAALVNALVLSSALEAGSPGREQVVSALEDRFARWTLSRDDEGAARLAAAIRSAEARGGLAPEVVETLERWSASRP